MKKINGFGFTLIELLVVLMITAILIIIAIPSVLNYIQTNRLSDTTQSLYFSLQKARSEAIKRNAIVYFSFLTGNTWCYGFNTGSACNCSTPSTCNLGATSAPAAQVLTFSTTGITGTNFQIEPTHGAVSASSTLTYTIYGKTTSMSVKIGLMGNLILCSSTMPGYPVCT